MPAEVSSLSVDFCAAHEDVNCLYNKPSALDRAIGVEVGVVVAVSILEAEVGAAIRTGMRLANNCETLCVRAHQVLEVVPQIAVLRSSGTGFLSSDKLQSSCIIYSACGSPLERQAAAA